MATSKAKAPAKKSAPKKVSVKKTKTSKAPAVKTLLGSKGIFHVEIEMNGVTVKGKTSSLARAIQSVNPAKLNTRVVMHIRFADKKKGTHVVEKVFNIPMARRMFLNTMSADILEKGIKMGLGYNG